MKNENSGTSAQQRENAAVASLAPTSSFPTAKQLPYLGVSLGVHAWFMSSFCEEAVRFFSVRSGDTQVTSQDFCV